MRAKGVDYNSKNKLKTLAEEGYSSTEIASMISVDEECVKNWMKYFNISPAGAKSTEHIPDPAEDENEDDSEEE